MMLLFVLGERWRHFKSTAGLGDAGVCKVDFQTVCPYFVLFSRILRKVCYFWFLTRFNELTNDLSYICGCVCW